MSGDTHREVDFPGGLGDTHVHPDNHVMVWVPGPGMTHQMLLGNDGGVYLSNPGVTGLWANKNAHLAITQFYKGAVDATGKNVLALGGRRTISLRCTAAARRGPWWVAVTVATAPSPRPIR